MTTSTSLPTNQSSVKPSYAGTAVIWGIVALMFLAAALAYPTLPDQIPTHWGFSGEPDAWSPKWPGAFIGPFIALALAILFPVLRLLDPKRKNYADFRKAWKTIQVVIILFMAYVEGITLFISFKPSYNASVGTAVTIGVGFLLIVLGNIFGKIRQNWFVGLRTPWTLDDPVVWQKSQRAAGWAFAGAGVAIILNTLFLDTNTYVFFSVIVAAAFGPMVYSYLLHRKLHAPKPEDAQHEA